MGEATRPRHPGLAIGGSWRLNLRSSRMQNTPVGTAPRENQEPSAESHSTQCLLQAIYNFSEYTIYYTEAISLSAWTLLVGRQKGHPACENTGCWFVGGDDLTGDLYVL